MFTACLTGAFRGLGTARAARREATVPATTLIRPDTRPATWRSAVPCAGRTDLFFAPPGERPEARVRREAAARRLCRDCPAAEPCRAEARRNREFGVWGGESEEERARAGFRAGMAAGGSRAGTPGWA